LESLHMPAHYRRHVQASYRVDLVAKNTTAC